jgi:hypothetical protein
MDSIPEIIEEPAGRPAARRPKRRLSDTILIAFHQACDQRDIEVAWDLLNVLEFMAMRMPSLPTGMDRRKIKESLVASHERLWLIRHPERPE